LKRALIFAAASLGIATAANAGELSELKSQSEQLRQQNEVLTKKIADLERRQRKLESSPATAPKIPAQMSANPADAMAATYKAVVKKLDQDDSLTWHGITLYGQVDIGAVYQDHGAPLNNSAGAGWNYLIAKNSNGSQFGVAPNPFGGSFVGLKGKQELTDGLYGVFNLQTAFNPQSGKLSDGLGSIVQNNGLAVGAQNSFADSARDGQPFNIAAWGGLSSPVYGTLTFGRQGSLTSDGVVAYDPLGSSAAFSLIGFQGATGGGGDTEDRIFDRALKYAVSYGGLRAAVETSIGAQDGAGPRSFIQGQFGGDYLGLSVDAVVGKITDAVTSAPLPVGTVLPASLINPGNGFIAGTVSDNTSVMLLAKYAYGPFKIFGGYEHIDFANPKTPLAAGNNFLAGYTLGTVNNTAFGSDKILQVFWTGAKYAVRSDFELTLAYYHEEQNSFQGGTPATLNLGRCKDASLAQCSGQIDAVSFVADYKFSPHANAYAGIMWSQVSNGLANGFLQRSSIDPTVGLRYRF
jgi:predicted porin